MTIEVLLPYLVGLLAVPIINFFKTRFDLSGNAAVYLALVVSALVAVAALALTGGFTGEDIAANISIAFAVATAAYKLLPEGVAKLGS